MSESRAELIPRPRESSYHGTRSGEAIILFAIDIYVRIIMVNIFFQGIGAGKKRYNLNVNPLYPFHITRLLQHAGGGDA